ncbi:hypothetical protein NEMBOFW57_003960 [Staphylotrichum longicolle]|uniref:Uncharacterized protein n=1 Tax=Staphylotrichum longicolle TaxID=669026 RepID=A0AAD4F783_9PEZI|nr:hypothetical protein NEMBOFW57_003960 [Staphylotrichum longicolle]
MGSTFTDTTEEKYLLLTPEEHLEDLAAEFERLRGAGKRPSKARSFINKTKPLIKLLERHGKALDVASNLSPQFLTPLWVSLRIIMKIATGIDEYFSRLDDILQRLDDVLPRFQVYGELFANHEKVQAVIFEVYNVVTAFVNDATKVFRSTGHVVKDSVWRDFDGKFEGTLSKLRRLSENVEKEARAAEMIEAKQAREEAREAREEARQAREEARQHQAEVFRLTAEVRRLTHALLEGAENKERTTVLALLRSWTFQLLKLIWKSSDYPVAWERAKRHLIASDGTEEARPRDVRELLLSILEAQDTPSCCLAVDAIDECVDSEEFVRFIDKIPKRFKILVTSQDPPDIQPRLTPFFRTLAVTPDLTQQDINDYIHDAVVSLRTPDNRPLPDDIQQEIKHHLQASDGMFLLIHLMIEDIKQKTTLEEIAECLKRLPVSLSERYGRIMDAINQQDPSHSLLARKVFFWVLTMRQPLTAKEFCAAQAVRPAAADRTLIYSPRRRLTHPNSKSEIQRVCGSLIRPRGDEGRLYPFHATVKEYLAQHLSSLTAAMAQYYGLPSVTSADALAAAVCMRYLTSDTVAALHDKLPAHAAVHVDDTTTAHGDSAWTALVADDPQLDFLRYAVTHWFHHAQHIGNSAGSKDDELLDMAADLLDGARPNAAVVWRLYWLLAGPERARSAPGGQGGCPAGLSGLHMAAYFGLARVVEYLVLNGLLDVAVVDGEGKTPLQWAAERGHTGVVKVLIDAGASLEAVGRDVDKPMI